MRSSFGVVAVRLPAAKKGARTSAWPHVLSPELRVIDDNRSIRGTFGRKRNRQQRTASGRASRTHEGHNRDHRKTHADIQTHLESRQLSRPSWA